MIPMTTLLAQAMPQKPPGGSPSAAFFPIAMMLAVVAFMLLSARSQRKREKRDRESMYAGITKNDRVLTVGGVIGTVVTVRESEVVLKVDEATNTKMTFIKSAVQKVMGDEKETAAQK